MVFADTSGYHCEKLSWNADLSIENSVLRQIHTRNTLIQSLN